MCKNGKHELGGGGHLRCLDLPADDYSATLGDSNGGD